MKKTLSSFYNRNKASKRFSSVRLPNNKPSKIKAVLSDLLVIGTNNRLNIIIIAVVIIIFLYIIRLFYLQIIKGDYYLTQAQEQQYSKIIIPAKRGEILTENFKTKETKKLATNTTLDLVYIDPEKVPDKAMVAKALAPILFDKEDFLACKEDYRLCPSGGVKFDDSQILFDKDIKNNEEKYKDTRTEQQLIDDYEKELLQKITKQEIDYVPLIYGSDDAIMDEINKFKVAGISVIKNKNLVYADPTQIDQTKLKAYAELLDPFIKEDKDYIKKLLTRRSVRYIPLKRKISPEASEKIWELKTASYEKHKKDTKNIPHYFKGVVLVPEHWRYYPENELASTIIGYVDHEGVGRYGLEERFQTLLQGKQGNILSKNDINGSQLIFDVSNMTEAIDGDSLILTIDPVVQYKVQELLSSAVEKYNADSGSIVVMEPYSGEVIAMGNYPDFNPNNFGEVYELRAVSKEEWNSGKIYITQPVFIKDVEGNFIQLNARQIKEEKEAIRIAKVRVANGEFDIDAEGNKVPVNVPTETQKYVYKNRFGLEAYTNKTVTNLYEPGSVFKPIAMAIALEAKEVTPNETYQETGPIAIDTGTGQIQYIRTALGIYRGTQTMTNAIEQSSNIGMAYVARKLGKELFYKYIKDFGFGEYTYVDLVSEQKGALTFWKKWPEAQLLTTSFGQGISVTPLQMATAWSALSNGGVLMQPKIIKSYLKQDGTKEDVPDKIVHRVISEETSRQITAILVSSVKNGVAKAAAIKGYHLAGKTGTSQIACSDSYRCTPGWYEIGPGTTATSFGGYAPVDKPKFIIIVKFERPRLVGVNTWGENTAAPVFKELTKFLLQYYDVPPDDL